MEFQTNLKKLRTDEGLTQDQLALLVETSTDTIGRIERKQKIASYEVLFRIARYFDKPVEDVILVFPEESKKNKTVRVLKLPKTESSIRKVFLPKSVAEMLVEWKKGQDKIKETLGDEYMDYNLVMATPFGLPIGTSSIRKALNDLIREHDLPPVVFHSLRHTSVTYKLKLNGSTFIYFGQVTGK